MGGRSGGSYSNTRRACKDSEHEALMKEMEQKGHCERVDDIETPILDAHVDCFVEYKGRPWTFSNYVACGVFWVLSVCSKVGNFLK